MKKAAEISKELCGPESPVDWTYPETGQTKPTSPKLTETAVISSKKQVRPATLE